MTPSRRSRLTQLKVLRIRNDAKTYKGRSPFRRFTHLVDLDLGGIPIPPKLPE
jgi:hypothetical protein